MQNFFDFTGKVVLVTGASSGIGRATAELFGRCGASVALTYLKNQAGADAAVAELGGAAAAAGADGSPAGGATGQTISRQADVIHTAEIKRAAREAVARFAS